MTPEITVHRPHGVLPKVSVQKRTVIDYQPSWLLLAIPTLVVVRSWRKRRKARSEAPDQPPVELPEGSQSPAGRWRRPVQVVVLAVPRGRRRRPTADAPDAEPAAASAGTGDSGRPE